MSDEEMVKQLYLDLSKASINQDTDALNEILAEDYILVHMTGRNQSKQEYIRSVQKGELKYCRSIHESITVKIEGNTANIVGKTKTFASPFGMSSSWWRLKQEIKAEKRNDKWVIKESIASTY